MQRQLPLVVLIVLALLSSLCATGASGTRWSKCDASSVVRVLADGSAALSCPQQVCEYLNSLAEQTSGWNWAITQGLLQPVNAEAEANGYKWHIYAVLADATQTSIVFTVEGAQPAIPRVMGPRSCTFNGAELRWRGASSKVIDGLCVGVMSFDPLPEQAGIVSVTAGMSGAVGVNWTVSFPASRTKCDVLTKKLWIGRELPLAGGTLSVTHLLITPVRTMLEATWTGAAPPDEEPHVPWLQSWYTATNASDAWGIRLLRPDGGLLARNLGGGRMQTHSRGDGRVNVAYTMFFDRCGELPREITLEIRAAVYIQAETRVPLEPHASASAADCRRIDVLAVSETGETGTVKIDYKPDPRFPPTCSDWLVLDTSGCITRMQFDRPAGRGFYLSWDLPPGRQAAAAILPGYWRAETVGALTVNTK